MQNNNYYRNVESNSGGINVISGHSTHHTGKKMFKVIAET